MCLRGIGRRHRIAASLEETRVFQGFHEEEWYRVTSPKTGVVSTSVEPACTPICLQPAAFSSPDENPRQLMESSVSESYHDTDLNQSSSLSSEWPGSYHRLGKPSSTAIIHEHCEEDDSDIDAMPVAKEFSLRDMNRSNKWITKVPTLRNSVDRVILKASHPANITGTVGRYAVTLVRTSLKQCFSLEFLMAETRDGRLSEVLLSDNFPHLGMSRWDRVLSLNGVEPNTAKEFCSMLNQQLSVVLLLESKSRPSCEPVHRPKLELLPAVDQGLITIRREALENDSDFMLTIARKSPNLRFDLPLASAPAKCKDRRALLVADDMPHLGVRAGDELLSVNGVHSPSQEVICKIFDTVIAIQIVFRTDPGIGRPSPCLGSRKWQQEPPSSGVQAGAVQQQAVCTA